MFSTSPNLVSPANLMNSPPTPSSRSFIKNIEQYATQGRKRSLALPRKKTSDICRSISQHPKVQRNENAIIKMFPNLENLVGQLRTHFLGS